MTHVVLLTVVERAEMAAHGWTCALCRETATVRVAGPGAFRLCAIHGPEVGQRLAALSESEQT